jgi:hypothetical protein
MSDSGRVIGECKHGRNLASCFDCLMEAKLSGAGVAPSAKEQQVGGDHYKAMPIQPVEYIHKNGIPFIEGCVIKYVSRWRAKNGVEDLKKARHYLDLLIEMEEAKNG